MLETAAAFLIGLLSGILTGLIPGINILVTMSLLYPVLLYFDTVNILVLYITLGACVQYFASVSGTFFGVVGSPSAIPAMTEGHALFRKGQGDKAIMHAAIGSFVGSMTALLITFGLLEILFVFYKLFDSRIKLIIFFITITVFVTTSNNKIWINILFLSVALIMGHVGYHADTATGFLTFGIPDLYSGLPLISVILSLFVVPNIILCAEENKKKLTFTKISFTGYLQNAKEMLLYKWIIFRSSLLGYLSGFVPGISYIIGVALSHAMVKHKKQKKGTYEKGDLHSLVASECANSSGSLSVILPLLLVGIPITGSQSLIYNIAMQSGVDLTIDYFQSMYFNIIIAYILTSLICVFISGKYVNWVGVIQKINFNYVYAAIILVLLIVLYALGSRTYQEWYFIIVFFSLLPIGYILRKFDITPAIYGFILSDQIYLSLNTVIAILK